MMYDEPKPMTHDQIVSGVQHIYNVISLICDETQEEIDRLEGIENRQPLSEDESEDLTHLKTRHYLASELVDQISEMFETILTCRRLKL